MLVSSLPQHGKPWVVAHRGVSCQFPENTRAAFAAAVLAGADAIECDLQLTRDDQIVVCHDASLDRFGHSEITITNQTQTRLRGYDTGTWFAPEFHDQRLLTLEELVQEFSGRLPLLLELKTETLAADRITTMILRITEIVTVHRARSAVSFLCFDDAVLWQFSRHAPWAVLVFNTHEPQQIDDVFLLQRPWLMAVDANIQHLTPEIVRTIQCQQRKALCFTCNSAQEVTKARDLAVDAIITNDPAQTSMIVQNYIPCMSSTSDLS